MKNIIVGNVTKNYASNYELRLSFSDYFSELRKVESLGKITFMT